MRPCVRPRGGTPEWDLEVGPWGVTLGWDPREEP